jgi:hypothetical protein
MITKVNSGNDDDLTVAFGDRGQGGAVDGR